MSALTWSMRRTKFWPVKPGTWYRISRAEDARNRRVASQQRRIARRAAGTR